MRRNTLEIKIGNIKLSSKHPVMVQSMLNTPTMDTEACIEQAIRIIDAGGQLVRITAQNVMEAGNLKHIRAGLQARGYHTPLSADIHFTPDAALVAACNVEKVRINPGNFVDKRAVFKELTYTDDEYAGELARLKIAFTGFLDLCRERGTAVRIGTNHGSLSDRIMSRYGDTPAGMVEATMEYLRICRETHFNDVVISLKSSDCSVMVDAVRLLVAQMEKEDMNYPLHLGVTEAGEGEDGRIRSAVGIGALLNEGIGDTIRVSLTEAPEAEIPVAKALVELCAEPDYRGAVIPVKGSDTHPGIVADISHLPVVDENTSAALGFFVGKAGDPVYGDQLHAGLKAPEFIYTEALGPELTKLPESVTVIVPSDLIDMAHVYNRNAVPLYTVAQYLNQVEAHIAGRSIVQIHTAAEINTPLTEQLKADNRALIVLAPNGEYNQYRTLLAALAAHRIENKVILKITASGVDRNQICLSVAAHTGGFFLDRLVYAIWVVAPDVQDVDFTLTLSRNMLQSAGCRRYKTEFVSCPGCGRTLFNLQHAVAQVKQAFAHLNTLKIAVMGCVVNGPGEMGDADYGYVGAGNGKVNLYKGRKMMKTAVPEQEAIAALKQLIVDGGDWCEQQTGV